MKNTCKQLAVLGAILMTAVQSLAFSYVVKSNMVPAAADDSLWAGDILPGAVVKDGFFLGDHIVGDHIIAQVASPDGQGNGLSDVGITWIITGLSKNGVTDLTGGSIATHLTVAYANGLSLPAGLTAGYSPLANQYEAVRADITGGDSPLANQYKAVRADITVLNNDRNSVFETSTVKNSGLELLGGGSKILTPDIATFVGVGTVNFSIPDYAKNAWSLGAGPSAEAAGSKLIVTHAFVPETTGLIPAAGLAGLAGLVQWRRRRNRKS